MKLKTYEDAEAVVVDHLPGKGKYVGMMGSLVVEMPDGRRSDWERDSPTHSRRSPPPVGAVVTYKFYGKTGNGIPRFASSCGFGGRCESPEAGRPRRQRRAFGLRYALPPAQPRQPVHGTNATVAKLPLHLFHRDATASRSG